MATVGRLEATLTLNTASFDAGINRGIGHVAQLERTVERGFGGIQRQANALRQAIVALGASFVVREIVQATVAFERINNTLRAGTGSAQGAAQAYAFVRSEAQRLGLDLRTAADQFGSLSAAARGTTLQGQAARDIFTAVAEAMTVLGRSSEQTEGAFRAIEQIISKGTVQAEELRGQLGERLPGAFQIAARSMGVTTQELGKLLQQGQVLSEDFLPKFAAELQKTFGPEAENAAKSLQASINRLNTAVFEFTSQVGRGGVASAITDFATGLTEASRGSENLARQLGAGLGTALRGIGQAFLFVARNFQAFTAAAAAFAAFKLAGIVIGIAGALIQMGRAIRLAAAGMVAFQAASKGIIGVAQAVAAGAAALAAYKAVAGDVEAETEALTKQLQEFADTLDETTPATAKLASGLDAAATSMANLLEQARRENEQLTALKEAHAGYGASVEIVNQAIEIDNALRAAKITRLEAEKAGLLEVLVANQRLRTEIAADIQAKDDQARAAAEVAEAQQRAQEEAASRAQDLLERPFLNAFDNIQSGMTDAFERILNGGVTKFSELASVIKDIFIRLAAELAVLMIIRPQVALSGLGLTGATGSAGQFGSLASVGGPLSSLSTSINALGAKLGFATPATQPSLPGAGAGAIRGFVPQQQGTLLGTGATLSQTLGAGAIGVVGGTVVGGLFGGQGGIGGGIGGGLGAAAGFALGGPIGALAGGAAGSLLGGLIGSIFGGGSGENQGTLRFESIAGGAFGGPFGGVKIGGENTFRAPLTDIIRKFDEGVAEFLTGRQEELATRAVQALGQFEKRFPEANPSAGFAEILRERATAVLTAAFPALKFDEALAGLSSVEEIADRVQNILEIIQRYNELIGKGSPAVQEAANRLSDLQAEFADVREGAKALGLSIQELNKAEKAAIATLKADVQREISDLLSGGDLGAQAQQLRDALAALHERFDIARASAESLGISIRGLAAAEKAAAAELRAAAREQRRAPKLEARAAVNALIQDPFGVAGASTNTPAAQFRQQMKQVSATFAEARQQARDAGLQQSKIIQLNQAERQAKEAIRVQTRQQLDELIASASATSDYGRELAAIRKQFREAKALANALGVSIAGLSAAQAKMIGALKDEVRERLAILTADATPAIAEFNNAMRELQAEFEEVRVGAKALGLSVAGLSEAQKRAIRDLKQQTKRDIEDQALAASRQFDAILGPLREFQAELKFSIASPVEQFRLAQKEFERIAGLAKAGDLSAIAALPQAGRLFLEQAATFGASPARVAAEAQIQAALANVITATTQAQEQATASLEREIRRASEREIDKLSELVTATQEQTRELIRLRNVINQPRTA